MQTTSLSQRAGTRDYPDPDETPGSGLRSGSLLSRPRTPAAVDPGGSPSDSRSLGSPSSYEEELMRLTVASAGRAALAEAESEARRSPWKVLGCLSKSRY